jgi:glycosyltransferase involved in cell wall biosynthesis
MNQRPKLVVYMVTYNHENYIDQAIQSVVFQESNFHFVLVIGDDCSTDSTYEKCLEWKEKYPHQIILKRQEKNLGPQANAYQTYLVCIQTGAEYIALLEGDDYWTDNKKLMCQVDLLDNDPDASASYHNTQIILANKGTQLFKKSLEEKMDMNSLLKQYSPFHTSSFIFRSKYFCWPDWFGSIDSVDLAFFMWLSQFGYFIGINQVMSAYRIHGTSMTASAQHREKFDFKRALLHRMMRGKISHKLDMRYQSLIDYHVSKIDLKQTSFNLDCAAFYCPSDIGLDFNLLVYRMKLNEEVVNFELGKNYLRMSLRNYKLFVYFQFLNRLIWKIAFKKSVGKSPSYIIFFRDEDLKRFIRFFGRTSSPAILLFDASPENEIFYSRYFPSLSAVHLNT